MDNLIVNLPDPALEPGTLVSARLESRVATLEVEFPRDGTEDLPVGQVVRLRVSGEGLREDVVLPGRTVFHGKEDASRYQFQVGLLEGAFIGNAMNRRGVTRVRPAADATTTVTVRDPVSERTCTPELYDISAVGVGLMLSLEQESTFSAAWNLEVELTLPEVANPITLLGLVHYRKLEGSGIRLGVQFDPKGDEGNRAIEHIRGYVERRQAELQEMVMERSSTV